jgi:hypothetical protein
MRRASFSFATDRPVEVEPEVEVRGHLIGGVPGFGGERSGVGADGRGRNRGADDLVIDGAIGGGGGGRNDLRLGIDRGLEHVEIIDRHVQFLVDGNDPATGIILGREILGSEAASRRLHLKRAEELDGGGHFRTGVRAFRHSPAEFGRGLLELELQQGRELDLKKVQ